jgi:hypothetical protein
MGASYPEQSVWHLGAIGTAFESRLYNGTLRKHWYSNIPFGKIVVLQTNNYVELKEHINCSTSLEEFAKQTPMSTVFYDGELFLKDYTRYMRIGIK